MPRSLSALVTLLAVLGCQPNPPPESTPTPAPAEPVVKADAPVAPIVADPVPPAEPATPEPAAAPAPSDAGVTWWCACYYRRIAGGAEPMTGCRASEAECRALQDRVGLGKGGIMQGTLTHPCQAVAGEHPGDAHGGREVWQPSKRAGSWISQGACRLPGPGVMIDIEARLARESEAKEEEDPFPVLSSERIGELKMSMSAADVVKLHGEPARRDKIEESPVDGAYHQGWYYPQLGLSIGMSADTRKGAQSINSITIQKPATLTTAKGVTIGSPRADVLELYGPLRDREMAEVTDERTEFIAGSIYGGMMFDFAGGKVTRIFLGAGAE